ncbi:MAG: TolC family protein [Cyclobacteriaceae bacterium]
MKYKLTINFIALIVTFPLFLQAQQSDSSAYNGRPMSLEDALAYAFVNSANIKNAFIDIQIAQKDAAVIKAQGLPQINANIDYTNNFAVPTVFLPAEAGAAIGGGGNGGGQAPATDEEIAIRFGIQHQANAAITASQMLFDGSYFVGLKAARTYADLMQKDYLLSKTNIAEQVSKAYYTALVNRERRQLVGSNLNRLDTLLRETTLLYENGFVEKIDVDRIKVQYNNIKTEYNRIDRLAEVSMLLLKYQMGMPIEKELVLAETIQDIELQEDLLQGNEFDYSDRLDYARLLVNYDLVKLDIKNYQIQYLPKLSLNANFGYNTGTDELSFSRLTNFDRWFSLGSAGVNLNLPIFDGLRKHNQIQKSKLQLQQLENANSLLKNTIDLEVVQSKVQLENSLENLKVQEENLDLARNVYEVTRIKYQEGVGSNLEVVDAETSLKQAETNYYNALYDALIAKVDLKKSLGTLINEN